MPASIPMRIHALSLFLLVWLPACAAAKWKLQDPGPVPPERREILAEAERRYRGGQDLAEQRQQIVADPVLSWWWTRVVVRDVVSAREGRIGAEEQAMVSGRQFDERIRQGRIPSDGGIGVLRATVGIKDPVERRALTELGELGVAAVPSLVFDLAQHPQGFVRQTGIDLLSRIGPAALPLVRSQLVESDAAQYRRTGAQVLGVLGADGVHDDLVRLAQDSDYSVRAAALSSLAGGGEAAASVLRTRLSVDEDPFVRRSAARALGAHRSRASALAVCDFLARCQRERDAEGCEAAQDALQEMAKSRGIRSLDAWRGFAEGL